MSWNVGSETGTGGFIVRMIGNGQVVMDGGAGGPAGAWSRRKLDLTGQRYGYLSVIGPAENFGGKTAWRCKCDCGRETVVKSYHLRDGHVKSCGCGKIAGRQLETLGFAYGADGACAGTRTARRTRKNNSSGVTGVHWQRDRQCWVATIHIKGKCKYLGCYKDFDEAAAARKAAEEELFGRIAGEAVKATVPGGADDGLNQDS